MSRIQGQVFMSYKLFVTRLALALVCFVVFLSAAVDSRAFSLLGPFNGDWHARTFGGRPWGLGYTLEFDVGGPVRLTEAYRWNVPVITYAFDTTFLQYFGTSGVAAVEEAIAVLNALPPVSRMSADLSEYPLDTKSQNGSATALGLTDVKSAVLSILLEQMGLANPERFVWALRGREEDTIGGISFTNYSVVQLNFDPVTKRPSRYVNGVLYNYRIFDDLGRQGQEWASAVEWYQLDPLYQPYSSVAGGFGASDAQLGSSPDDLTSVASFFGAGLRPGEFYTGLTRDDVGGLRHLLSTNVWAFNTLLPTVLPRTSGVRGSPWSPILGSTNATGISNIVGTVSTNLTNFTRTAFRPGLDKITFQRVHVFGTNFTPITLRYTDRFLNPTNGRIVRQSVERLVLQPDIIFDVRDLGLFNNTEIPVTIVRSDTSRWTNNAALNSYLGALGLAGPGTIFPPIFITLSDTTPYWLNDADGPRDDQAIRGLLWGSFDGTVRPPVVFPVAAGTEFTLEYIQDVVLGRRRR